MSECTEYAPGTFCWAELGTNDEAGARSFYAELFDWQTEISPMGAGMGDYTTLRKRGKDVGGLYKLFPEQVEQGVPPNWLPYVSVASAEAAAARAAELGGTVLSPAIDVLDIGRLAVLQDPVGATLAVWEAKTRHGSEIVAEPGAICWNELLTHDTAKAGAFYAGLFGWSLQSRAMGPIQYTMLMQGQCPAGGMMSLPPEMGAVPPHWMVYFAVDDCDEDVRRATALGAKVCAPPSDVPGAGRMAVLADPQGAAFAIIKLSEPQG